MSGFDLLARRLDFDGDTTVDATEVVRKAADRAKVPITRPERFRGEDLLDNLAEVFRTEVDRMQGRIVSLIQPVLTILLGIIVLFVLLSMFLPYFSILMQGTGR